MEQFIVENWLALIGALAWLPVLIELIANSFRKVRYVYLDKTFVYNLIATFINNGVSRSQKGMMFIIALNLFVYKRPFFPKKVVCTLKLKDGAKHTAELYEGEIGYSDTQDPPKIHKYAFDDKLNMNMNRSIFADQDNIRVLPFFFENLNMENDENIEEIEIVFYGRFIRKTIRMKTAECQGVQFISNYDIIIGQGKSD